MVSASSVTVIQPSLATSASLAASNSALAIALATSVTARVASLNIS
jgi:hypothetical protein